MSTLRTFFDIDGDMDWLVVSSNTNVVNGKGYIVDTSIGSITITLPASPVVGDAIGIKDLSNNFGTNNLTINRNGKLIDGVASNRVISVNGYGNALIYSGEDNGWLFSVDNLNVTSVSGTTPIVSSGGTTPTISITAATTSAAGSMSSADKTKLDGIASGAQVNVATDIGQGTLTSTTIPLTSSTGTGTTLPAATTSLAGLMSSADKTKLDGISGSGGGSTITDDTTTSITQYLGMSRVTGGSWTDAYVSSTKLYFNPSTGTLNATIFNSLSDATQKSDIVDIGDALVTVKELRGVEFNWKDNGKKSSGVIAQELEKILPHLVDTNDNGLKSVNYSGIIGYLIEAIKDLNDKIDNSNR